MMRRTIGTIVGVLAAAFSLTLAGPASAAAGTYGSDLMAENCSYTNGVSTLRASGGVFVFERNGDSAAHVTVRLRLQRASTTDTTWTTAKVGRLHLGTATPADSLGFRVFAFDGRVFPGFRISTSEHGLYRLQAVTRFYGHDGALLAKQVQTGSQMCGV